MVTDVRINLANQDESIMMTDNNSGENFKLINYGKGSRCGNVQIISADNLEIVRSMINIQIGRYTSIGDGVKLILDMNHNYSSVYQGVIAEFGNDKKSVSYFDQLLSENPQKGQILIGNDCWIGSDVVIKGGVTVNDGAVIGAGSVVTQDVPAYAIVEGNPAKVIKYRFPYTIIDKLRKIEWWYWNSDQLISAKDDMQGDVRAFVTKYSENALLLDRKSGKYLPRISGEETSVILCFMDFDDSSPVYSNAIASFVKEFREKEAELVLCYNGEDESEVCKMEEVCSCLNDNLLEGHLVNVCGISKEDEEKIISEVDYLITNRSEQNLRRVSYANKYNVKCLSGVDIPLFTASVCRQIKRKFRMFVVGHKPFDYYVDSEYMPIQVAKPFTKIDMGILSDDTGDNIANKNPNYCELTAMYWIWKNYSRQKNVRYIGMCHYRRYLMMGDRSKPIDGDLVDKLLSKCDFILPQLIGVEKSAREWFVKTSGYAKDLDITEALLRKDYPEYVDAWVKRLAQDHGHYCNIMITSVENYNAYCEWMFEVLGKLEKLIDITGYTQNQARIFGFISEFLVDVWINTHRKIYVEVPLADIFAGK